LLRRRLDRFPASPPVASDDEGRAGYRIFGSVNGVCVEMRRPRAGKGLATHVMLFSSEADFLKWCEAEPLRFSNPLLHAKLMRHGCALLATRPSAPESA
jgi:hypothetical protein